jgi:hypothetical protein
LTASVLGQLLGIAALVGIYLSLVPHRGASALLLTSGVMAGVLVLAAISAGLELARTTATGPGLAEVNA